MPWHSLGVITPTELTWIPFQESQTNTGLFRVLYSSASFDRLDSFGWVAWRYTGGEEVLPPTRAERFYPDIRGRLLEVPYPPELLDLGYSKRIFEVKRNRKDLINWSMQIEELI